MRRVLVCRLFIVPDLNLNPDTKILNMRMDMIYVSEGKIFYPTVSKLTLFKGPRFTT